MKRWLALAAVLASLFVLGTVACSSSPDAPPASDDGGDASVDDAPVDANANYPAPHPAPAQVVSLGGSVLSGGMYVVPVFYAGDTNQTKVETFLHQLQASTYWASATSEYGVGPLTIGDSLIVQAAAPAAFTYVDADALAGAIDQGTAPIGDVDGGTTDGGAFDAGSPPPGATRVLALFFPCNKATGSYHSEHPTGAGSFPYAVVSECLDFDVPLFVPEGIDNVTLPISHELVETATDPYSATGVAYGVVDDDHGAWPLGYGGFVFGEVGDLCAWQPPPNVVGLAGVDNLAQRVWSNAAATAGHDPCVPAPPGPYFATAPVFVDDVRPTDSPSGGPNDFPEVDGGIFRYPTIKGIKLVNVGDSETIDLDLFSDGPTPGPWTITPQELTRSTATLSFQLDRDSGLNGDVLHLTVTRIAAGTAAPFMLTSAFGPLTVNSHASIAFGFVSSR